MANITVELELNEYNQLKEEAIRLGKAPDVLIQELVSDHLKKAQPEKILENERVTKALKDAGLLTVISSVSGKLADPNISLEEVQKAMSRDGLSLSEIVIESRGPKI